jgi:DNA-binding NtrC family response regulator
MVSADKNSAHILIVDDEPKIRDIMQGLLSENYRCTEADSAEAVLWILRTEKFDLVISDIKMDCMSGLEMIPQVRAIAPDTVIMMISGEQTIEGAMEALRGGAFDYITKPFDFQHVEAAVWRLEHHSLLEAKRHHLARASRPPGSGTP